MSDQLVKQPAGFSHRLRTFLGGKQWPPPRPHLVHPPEGELTYRGRGPLTLEQYRDYAFGDRSEILRREIAELLAHNEFLTGYEPPPPPPWHERLLTRIGTGLIRAGVWLGGYIDDE